MMRTLRSSIFNARIWSVWGWRNHSFMAKSTKRPAKLSASFTVKEKIGALNEALHYFWKNKVNMTRIVSRPSKLSKDFEFSVDFEGKESQENIQNLLKNLKEHCHNVVIIGSKSVPWFPRVKSDIDFFSQNTLVAGEDLEADHPGFSDRIYRNRRLAITQAAKKYRHGSVLPSVKYTKDETSTWGAVYDQLMPLLKKHACKEYLEIYPQLSSNAGYSRDNIPQLVDISKFLEERTGFTLRPVAGLLSPRDFFNGLAFRVFFSTQYIRHHSKPLYTPEPDIVHELMGHVPMFGNAKFADFSQEIGLASIGATDDQIVALARCYWYTVEFGQCEENGVRKAFGAGLLSSFGELEYSMSDKPEFRPWDPFHACEQNYPITTYQPVYYVAKSFDDATKKMRSFADSLERPFHVSFNKQSNEIDIDRNVKVLPRDESS